jgi:phenylpropionate dioxygenase-like ring-hydroxylating dioxygenase large terminal subunit
MFIPCGTKADAQRQRPATSGISANDWAILADFWYPVAYSHEIIAGPVKARLLDIELVLYRGASGAATVAIDACPHRHVRLSAGRIQNGEIICPFHGLRFDGDGKCQHVPALGKQLALPKTYRLQVFPAVERYGMVWTCIGNPDRRSIPDFPSLGAANPADIGYAQADVWPVSAPRQIENFADLAHLPLVHGRTLEGAVDGAVKPGQIEHTADAVVVRAAYTEGGRSRPAVECSYVYRIVLPFAIEFTVRAASDPHHSLDSWNIASPVSAHECRVFQLIHQPGDRAARDAMLNVLRVVNGEDIAILEHLAVKDMPLDQHFEIHLPPDNICQAYRSRLRDFGLGGRA